MPSARELTQTDWEEIGKHDTFGLNFWLLHPFVPRFYFTEGFRHPSEAEYFKQVLHQRGNEYAGVTWLVQTSEVTQYLGSAKKLLELFPWDKDPPLHWLRYRRVLVPKERKYNQTHFKSQPVSVGGKYLKGFGSLTLALSVLAAMEYREIVLIGVDLDSSEYFWQQPSSHHHMFRKEESNTRRAKPHSTSSHAKYHPVQNHILAFNRFVLKRQGCRLLSASPKGELGKILESWSRPPSRCLCAHKGALSVEQPSNISD